MSAIPGIRTDTPPDAPFGEEHDACALFISVRKRGESTYGTLKRALGALAHMGHRTGLVNGEGDGAGIQTDIPRRLWAKTLSQAGLRSSLATDPRFWVGQAFIPPGVDLLALRDDLSARFNQAGLGLLLDQPGRVRPEALGPQARQNAPTFWQFAGCATGQNVEARLFEVQTALEAALPVHFTSLSTYTVVYKVRGAVETLPRFYPDLRDHDYDTAIALCHARYSTNTVSTFERVQPFALLGHNGEINTISRFRQEAAQLGVRLDPGNSDSQDVDRALHALCLKYGLDLIEAMEMVFPPVPHEVEHLPSGMRSVYTRMRHAFGPYAQGPAAVVARQGDLVVASVDALGLRPLWLIETEKEYILSSERGVVPLEHVVQDARPLAPGEKAALRVHRGREIDVLTHADMRRHLLHRAFEREAPFIAEKYWSAWESDTLPGWPGGGRLVRSPGPEAIQAAVRQALPASPAPLAARAGEGRGFGGEFPQVDLMSEATVAAVLVAPYRVAPHARPMDTTVLAAAGWNREHGPEIEALAGDGKDPVGSLGWDGPLAVISRHRVNLADFFKETVAVVTNPAIDRERETEVFSTRVLVGARPAVGTSPSPDDVLAVLETPLLAGGHPALGGDEVAREVADALGTMAIDDLLTQFNGRVAALVLGVYPGENVQAALERLKREAVEAVRGGVQCLLLDDGDALRECLGWLDPHLATGVVDRALREAGDEPNLRRRTGLVVRSAAIRSLHDVALLVGFGADALNPYAMLAVAVGADRKGKAISDPAEMVRVQHRLLRALTIGLEKVISTIGCHELRGYGRVFSAVGLAPGVAAALRVPNYFGSERVGLTWERLDREACTRAAELRGEVRAQLAQVDHFYPKFYKKAQAVADGELSLDEFIEAYRNLTVDVPVTLRHALGFKPAATPVDPAQVDLSIGVHDLPLLISAMSFGSQGELSYRAYAESAVRLNIVCINGEGGELPELMDGTYKRNRGQQVASGRFGVNAQFLNSAWLIEIKIGQGAKPGEGGMLPAAKVTPKVALARRTSPHVTLISPSNNHDIYSIEDLAQLIEELKTVNPEARVSVKMPVVPGIGIIAVGVAKAGADVISVSGYDGGTGAARRHALQYVGLPTEIGVIEAHRALIDAGLRHRVELWCDGGMKTGADAMKMILLGANRVGFATMAMVAVGCTICRKCHEGTCHVGITTHIQTVEEAQAKGLKSFVPREYAHSVEAIVRMFGVIGDELRRITAQLGATRLQDLVGRADLLEQVQCLEQVDLSPALVHVPMRERPPAEPGVGRRLTRPRNNLTRIITDEVVRAARDDEREMTYQDEVMAFDRVLGSHLAGELVRSADLDGRIDTVHLNLGPSAIGGNGFAAWVMEKIDILVEGGAQDGAAKSANGGRVAIMRGLNHEGQRLDGSVGKCFAYGAQRGVLIVQGDADTRPCIRLSGADVIFGGELKQPLDDTMGVFGTHANLKGFACEYMTSGRVLILGDPGPYGFAGMTGGVVYQCLTPEMGLDQAALQRRIAKGAKVHILPVDEDDLPQIQGLLGHYITALEQTDQPETAARIRQLAEWSSIRRRFVKIVPPPPEGDALRGPGKD